MTKEEIEELVGETMEDMGLEEAFEDFETGEEHVKCKSCGNIVFVRNRMCAVCGEKHSYYD